MQTRVLKGLWWGGGAAGVAMLAALVWFVFGGVPGQRQPANGLPANLDLSRQRVSEHGLFRVTIAPREGVVLDQSQGWTVNLAAADGKPLSNARIAVDGEMPQYGHTLSTRPQILGGLGDGNYFVEGVRFNMSGWWTLKLDIEVGGQKDSVTFNVVVAP